MHNNFIGFTFQILGRGFIMLRCMLRAEIHMATVTESNLSYEGSLTLDEDILKKGRDIPL